MHLSATTRTETRRRWIVGLAATALVALLVYDLWALQPYLQIELARLEPWKVALVLVGDCVCLFWFLWYVARHFVMGQPLRDRPDTGSARWKSWAFVLTMVLGLAADLTISLYFRHEEMAEYEAATRTIAEVKSMKTRHGTDARNWELRCEFVDSTGTRRETTVRVYLSKKFGFPPTLDGATAQLLLQDRLPPQVPIRYLPSWPARTWLDGVSDDGNSLAWASIAAIFFQAIPILVISLLGYRALRDARWRGMTPWWLELHQAIPASIQILVLAFMGMLIRLFG